MLWFYVALPFVMADDGVAPGDPSSGDFGDAKVIRKLGEVPDDLSAL